MKNFIPKSIDTIYDGHKFRSRLEARWAVFFNEIGCKYEYELEGFELSDGTRYLPDFYLPEHSLYIEIKPSNYEADSLEKPYWLHIEGGKSVVVICGSPGVDRNMNRKFHYHGYTPTEKYRLALGEMTAMHPLLFMSYTGTDVMQHQLRCPYCNENFVHFENANVFKIQGREAIDINFSCEFCHDQLAGHYDDTQGKWIDDEIVTAGKHYSSVRMWNHKGDGYWYYHNHPIRKDSDLINFLAGGYLKANYALLIAGQARFEFGQTPKSGGRI